MEEKQDQEVNPQGTGLQPEADANQPTNYANNTRSYIPRRSQTGSAKVPTVRIVANVPQVTKQSSSSSRTTRNRKKVIPDEISTRISDRISKNLRPGYLINDEERETSKPSTRKKIEEN